jgi:hypothetical protein
MLKRQKKSSGMDSSKRRQGIIVTTTLEEIHGRTTTDPQQLPKAFNMSKHANNITTIISAISKIFKFTGI